MFFCSHLSQCGDLCMLLKPFIVPFAWLVFFCPAGFLFARTSLCMLIHWIYAQHQVVSFHSSYSMALVQFEHRVNLFHLTSSMAPVECRHRVCLFHPFSSISFDVSPTYLLHLSHSVSLCQIWATPCQPKSIEKHAKMSLHLTS